MTYHQQFTAKIARLGREAKVKTRKVTGENEFGNETDGYVTDRIVLALRSYPNRNTEVESSFGDRIRDRPVFFVPKSPALPEAPQPEEVLVYAGQSYEVKAHTEYDTHIEFMGEKVEHESEGA